MKQICLGAALALSLSTQLAGQQPVPVTAGPDDKVTVVGCVVKGDGGYVLASPVDPAIPRAAGTAAATVASASSVAGHVFYWLDDDDEIDEHAGRKVEVTGELEDDIDQGTISVEREDGMVEIEFKAEGERKVTIKIPDTPAAIGTPGAVSDREKDYRVVIRKVDVDSVKVLASTCH
jgi:hypothetical protein